MPLGYRCSRRVVYAGVQSYPWHAPSGRSRCGVGQSAACNGAGGRQEQHRIVVGGRGGRRVRATPGQPQGTSEGVLPQAGGVHVHAGGRRRLGGGLRGGRRVLFHTD